MDKVNIEKLQTDKVEFNVETIDVEELSGMLNIGMNFDGKLIKAETKAGEQKTKENKKLEDLVKSARPPDVPIYNDKAIANEQIAAGPKPKIKIIFGTQHEKEG